MGCWINRWKRRLAICRAGGTESHLHLSVSTDQSDFIRCFGSRPAHFCRTAMRYWDIVRTGHQLLTAAGYKQYKKHQHAKQGAYQCQHNLNLLAIWHSHCSIIGCTARTAKSPPPSDGHSACRKTHHPRGGFIQGKMKQRDVGYRI